MVQFENLDLTNDNLLGDEFSNITNVGVEEEYANMTREERKKRREERKEKRKSKRKKFFKKLKDKIGKVGEKFRNKFRKIMRNGILFMFKHNAHGYSTRLYPAVAPSSNLKGFKPSSITTAKKSYAEVVQKWKGLGGEESDLRSAILQGGKSKFLAPKKTHGFNGEETTNFDSEFYGGGEEISGLTNEGLLNTYGADGDGSSDTGGDAGTDEVPDSKESKKGIKAFFHWLGQLFKKHKANDDADSDNPYLAGSDDANSFDKQAKADAPNVPNEISADEKSILNQVEETAKADKSGTPADETSSTPDKPENVDDNKEISDVTKEEKKSEGGSGEKFLGMPKAVGITVAVVGGLAVLVGGFFLVRKMVKK